MTTTTDLPLDMTPAQEMRYTQALWYAWGRADGGTDLVGDAFTFAAEYLARYRAFENGRTVSMPSMMTAFDAWQEGRPLALAPVWTVDFTSVTPSNQEPS